MQQISIFLASRFGEFAQVRSDIKRLLLENRNLNARIHDLNDGAVSHRPVLDECRRFIEQSDLVLLLLGTTYGELAPGEQHSFTELEYMHAVTQGKRVLPFFIGPGFTGSTEDLEAMDERLRVWASRVRTRHVCGVIDASLSSREQASDIVRKVFSEVFELLGIRWEDAATQLTPEALAAIEEQTLQNASRSDLEVRQRQSLGLSAADTDDDLPDGPEATASREQRRAAEQAMLLGEFALALDLLQQAVKRHPLDPEGNEQYASFILAMAGTRVADQAPLDLATTHARLARKVYEARGQVVRAVGALILLSRIQQREHQLKPHTNALDAALTTLDDAQALRPNDVSVHLARARLHLQRGRAGHEAAIDAVMRAAGFRADILQTVFTDPDFRSILDGIRKRQLKDQDDLRRDARDILETEARLGVLLQRPASPQTPQADLNALLRQARQSVQRQRWILAQAVSALVDGPLDPAARTAEAQRAVTAAQREVDRVYIQKYSVQARLGLPGHTDAEQKALHAELGRIDIRSQEVEFAYQRAVAALEEVQSPVPVLPPQVVADAIRQFERKSVSSRAQLLPYPALYNPRHRTIVRMSDNDLARFTREVQRHWRRGSPPEVIKADAPAWWPAADDKTRRLYLVEIEPGSVPVYRLLPAGAYTTEIQA